MIFHLKPAPPGFLENLMNKFFAIFNISWQNMLIYRLNFILWRFRTVLQLILIYFIWWTVFQTQSSVFGYTETTILTYVLVSAFTRAIVLSSRIMDIGGHISEGGIVNFLVKPQGITEYYFARDLADKLLNISFVFIELIIIYFLLKPEIIIQTNPAVILQFILSIILAIILYFALSFAFGLLAFWLENIWGIYFLFFMSVEALGGGLFPIDILPEKIAIFLLLTPFPYLLYFPAKVYSGTLNSGQLTLGFSILIFWVLLSWVLMKKVLNAGLRTYSAVGH